MNVIIAKSVARGKVAAPPSKSYAHRLLVCAALARGESVIRGVSASGDMAATLDCMEALGAHCERTGDAVRVRGAKRGAGAKAVFPCRESGSTLRFFIPLAPIFNEKGLFTGTERLMERGAGIYGELLPKMGATVEKSADGIRVFGTLKPGEYRLPGNVSSQFVSGLMFALPLLDGDSVIHVTPPVESRAYIDITLDALKSCGVMILETEENVFSVRGGQEYGAMDRAAEGDWSNAAFLLALNELGGDVEVTGLDTESLQGDRTCLALFEKLRKGGDGIDISGCPDLGPVLFALAAAGNGGRFTGIRRLRIKESDRAAAMAGELRKFGIDMRVTENDATVSGGGLHAPDAVLSGHNDHRIVMALSVLSTMTGGVIEGAEAVNKSYPDFFKTLCGLGVEMKNEI